MYPQYWTSSVGGIFMRYSYEYKRMCVELYQQGKWPETPTGISEHSFRVTISPNMEQIKDMLNKAFKRFPSTQGLIISTITITAGSKRKQNGCLPLNSGKHPGWKLNYSILNRCPENRVHIKPLTLPISENILIDEHEPVYTFHGRRSIIALTTRLHFPDE